eukprot:519918-Lingulodinium_polyedra.AAC.1
MAHVTTMQSPQQHSQHEHARASAQPLATLARAPRKQNFPAHVTHRTHGCPAMQDANAGT